MPQRTASLVALLLAVAFLAPSAGAVTGELRTLYVIATWGPTPFTQADLESVAAETDAFFRASSSGRFSMPGSVAGPITLPRPVFDSCDATALRSEASPSLFTGYDRVAFVTPIVERCQFFGEANPTEVLLNGRLFRSLAVHELGHTLSLGHASRWACTGGRCTIDEYGSLFSVMGGGDGDFNAYEKSRLDWLTGVVRPRRNGLHEIGPVEGPTALPQALVVRTAASEFWFESRGLPTPSFMGGPGQPAGVAVIAGPGPAGEGSVYPRENLLLPNPGGGARYSYAPGESFMLPRLFRVTVERHAHERAALRFEWLDRTAPGRPRLRGRGGRGRVRLTWEASRERGSGVESYTLVVDGRAVRTISREIPLIAWQASLRMTAGRHRIGVFATDRAGNRGRPAWVRVHVR
jgi:hypothetical protein